MIAEDNPRMVSLNATIRQLTAEEKVKEACEARRRYSNDIATYEQEIRDLQGEKKRYMEERDKANVERDKFEAENTKLREMILELQKKLEESHA